MKSLVEFIEESSKISPLGEYINEAKHADLHTATVKKKLAKGMTEEDKKFVTGLRKSPVKNYLRSTEEIEQILWKLDKERIDEMFEQAKKILDYTGFTPTQVVDTYSLARSGKQMKIEVIAQVGYFAYEAIEA